MINLDIFSHGSNLILIIVGLRFKNYNVEPLLNFENYMRLYLYKPHCREPSIPFLDLALKTRIGVFGVESPMERGSSLYKSRFVFIRIADQPTMERESGEPRSSFNEGGSASRWVSTLEAWNLKGWFQKI